MTNTHIEFDQIPGSLRYPGVYSEYNNKGAVTALPTNEQSVLIIAPMLSAESNSFTVPQPIFNDSQAAEYFGDGSWAHLMAQIALKNNALIRLSVLGLADAESGVAATGSVALTGTATNAGVVTVMLAGIAYKVAASATESAESLARRLSAVVNSATHCPVSARVSNSTVNFTAKCKGEIGNEIAIAVDNTVSGINIEATAFSGGQTNADLTPALASVAGTHYHVIISPFTDDANASALRHHLMTASSPIEKKPGIGVLGWRGSMARGTTFAEKLNSERLTIGWYKGAIESSAIIAGEEDPARPLNTLEIAGLTEVDATQTPLFSESNQALFHGLTPITVVNHKVQILRAITTYTKNATNTDDPSYLDLTTIRSLDYVRKSIEQRIALRFPRSKLTTNVKNKVRSEVLDVLYRLEGLEVVENVNMYKAKLQVDTDPQDPNRLDLAIPTDVVNGLHVVAARIDLIL